MRIDRVVVHGEPSEPAIDAGALARRLAAALGPRVSAEGRPAGLFSSPTRRQARALAACIVHNPRRPFERREPDAAAVEREMRGGGPRAATLYDGFEMQRVAASMIPGCDAAGPHALHVALTDRLPCTYDPGGMRYHGRALVAASPALVSTTGMVEAPARPRRYYIDMMASQAAGGGAAGAAAVDREYAGAFLKAGDARLAEAAYGYALQAAVYCIAGEAFCADRDCRLYNAHWQSDLLRLQVRSGRLCGAHRAILAAHAHVLRSTLAPRRGRYEQARPHGCRGS